MNFSLKFRISAIPSWAKRYMDVIRTDRRNEWERERQILEVIAPRARQLGYLTQPDFMSLVQWKTPRPRPSYEKNSEEFIEEVTRTSFSTKNEQLRIEVLTVLNGVNWPVASAILHVVYENRYPMIDYRALYSVGVEGNVKYDFPFWEEYIAYCRELAKEAEVNMRDLDRALWQYSWDKQ